MKRTRDSQGDNSSSSSSSHHHNHRYRGGVLGILDSEDTESGLGLEEDDYWGFFKLDSNNNGEIVVINYDDDDDDDDNNHLSSFNNGGDEDNDCFVDCSHKVESRCQQQQKIFCPFHALTDDVNLTIFQFVGPNQFLFVAGVCRQFYQLYALAHGSAGAGAGAGGIVAATAGVRSSNDDNNQHQQTKRQKLLPSSMYTTSLQCVIESISRCKFYLQEGDQSSSWFNSTIVAKKKDDTRDVFELCKCAARSGNLQVLQYLLLDETLFDLGLVMMSTTTKFPPDLLTEAAKGGHLHVVKWLRNDFGCDWKNSQICSEAARGGHLDLLKWAKVNGFPCYWEDIFRHSALGGHLDILQWALPNVHSQIGFIDWHACVCMCAARNGHLEVLKWARANGFHWDAHKAWNGAGTTAVAAQNGHLDILKWARANGCTWDSSLTSFAAQNGHYSVLKWAIENGCPCRAETLKLAAENGHPEVYDWASENRSMEDVTRRGPHRLVARQRAKL